MKRIAKKYLAFLTVAGGAPLALTIDHLIPAPPGYENLKYVASFVCLMTFCGVSAYRDLIAQMLEQSSIRKRWMPALAVFMAIACALLMATYLSRLPSVDSWQIVAYISVWPPAVASATMLLIFLYYQQDARYRFLGTLDVLTDHREEIITTLEQYAHWEAQVSADPVRRVIGAHAIQRELSLIHGVMQGEIRVNPSDLARTFGMLGDAYARFDAVSTHELPFWTTKGDPFATAYFELGEELVRKGKTVNRRLLLATDEADSDVGMETLLEVLLKHRRAGIGFSVGFIDELPTCMRQLEENALDFALWDSDKAYSVFRQNEGSWARTMRVTFEMDSNKHVAKKVELYAHMLPHTLLVDRTYKASHGNLIHTMQPRLTAENVHLQQRLDGQFQPDGDFFLEVTDTNEIEKKVRTLAKIRQALQVADSGELHSYSKFSGSLSRL